MGLLLGVAFGYSSGIVYGLVGFFAGFMGVMLHLLGDIMTHMAFKPLWPFKDNEVAWHWFKADNSAANNGFFTLGIIAFFGYVLIASGALQSII